MITKQCTKCQEVKPLDEFYNHPQTKDGKQGSCKNCHYEYMKRYRATPAGKEARRRESKRYYATERGKEVSRKANAKHRKTKKRRISNRQYDAKRTGTPKRLESHRKANIKYKQTYPEKVKAKRVVNNAIRDGKWPRADTFSCFHCNEEQAIEYHHYLGYDEQHWFDVRPTCKKCHIEQHYPHLSQI